MNKVEQTYAKFLTSSIAGKLAQLPPKLRESLYLRQGTGPLTVSELELYQIAVDDHLKTHTEVVTLVGTIASALEAKEIPVSTDVLNWMSILPIRSLERLLTYAQNATKPKPQSHASSFLLLVTTHIADHLASTGKKADVIYLGKHEQECLKVLTKGTELVSPRMQPMLAGIRVIKVDEASYLYVC